MVLFLFLHFLFIKDSARILTLNVNSLRDVNKRLSLLQWMSHFTADFVALQETHASPCQDCSSLFSPYGYSVVSSPGSEHSCGVALLFRHRFTLTKSVADKRGRFIMAEFKLDEVSFRLACIYARNWNPYKKAFFDFVTDSVAPAISTLTLGEFNAVFDRSLDRRGPNPLDESRESSNTLCSLFDVGCVADIWRHLHPALSSFTWMKPDGSLASRIDLIECPFPWIQHVSECVILPCLYSDHSVVSPKRKFVSGSRTKAHKHLQG